MYAYIIFLLLSGCTGFPCQNGGTYDAVYDRCECSPDYFGYSCETSFNSAKLCEESEKLPVIADPEGLHRPGAAATSKGTQVDFSSIDAGWYSIASPWGNQLIEGCHSGVMDSDCGGKAAYVLHDIVAEQHSTRPLFKARAYRVWRERKSCRLEHETVYPVRILKCSESLKLYYLPALPRTHSYCIGGERYKSDELLAQIYFPKKPVLELKYAGTDGLFNCLVYGPKKNVSINNSFSIRFNLTTKDGKVRTVGACNKSGQYISPSCKGNCSFVCPWSEIANPKSNIYGATLTCHVQAEKASVPISSSNPHSFQFRYTFTNASGTIKPGKPVELCISSWSIPTSEQVTFSFTVARRITSYRKDKIKIAIMSNDENKTTDSCETEIFSSPRRTEHRICVPFVLYNEDHEGRHVFGLNTTEQLSVARINISYKSSADGLYTYTSTVEPRFQQIESIEMKVDLRTFVSGPRSYLHIFSDPYVKPVGCIYGVNSTYELKANRGENASYVAMRHKILPYEVQILITRPQSAEQNHADATVVTRVAVRYHNHIITVYGMKNEANSSLRYEVTCKGSEPSSECNMRRHGLKIESTTDVIRIDFEFYGTIIYVWKFRTHLDTGSSCAHSFIMSKREMKRTACEGSLNLLGNEFVLDLTIIPSMYDYEGNVEGLMYTSSAIDAEKFRIRNSSEDLLSKQYTFKAMDKTSSLIRQPYEILKICNCGVREVGSRSNGCLVDVMEPTRTRRDTTDLLDAEASAAQVGHNEKVTSEPSNGKNGSIKKRISAVEAQHFCAEFLAVEMLQRNYSISICTGHSQHPLGVDYATQFEYLCVRYTLTLGTFEFAETLLNSMLDACRRDVGYNATEVRSQSRVLTELMDDICPKNCSNNGYCSSGACVCHSGYSGRGCESLTMALEDAPTRISTSNQNFVCASENCSSSLLLVSPMLKSTEADCIIETDSMDEDTQSNLVGAWSIPADFAAGTVMVCNLSKVHVWLRDENLLYAFVRISLVAAKWNSSNSVRRLLVQSQCAGRPTRCYSTDKKPLTNQQPSKTGWRCFSSEPAAGTSLNECRQEDHRTIMGRWRTAVIILGVMLIAVAGTANGLYYCLGRPRIFADAVKVVKRLVRSDSEEAASKGANKRFLATTL